MTIDYKGLRKPLTINEVEFRVQSINRGGYATILVYKDARVDMNRLDEVVGAENWQRQHLNNNANCIISVWDEAKGLWVHKEDTGTESMAEKEKGLASDSFKRAGFNWGIGRELYDYPIMSVKLNSNEFKVDGNKVKPTFDLKIREWKWSIERDENDDITKLEAVDQFGSVRFSFPKPKKEKEKELSKEDKNINLINSSKTIKELQANWNSIKNPSKAVNDATNAMKTKLQKK